MLLVIALGGAAGTLGRYGIGLLAQRTGASFPFGTLAINVVGSFLLGLFARSLIGTTMSPELRVALTVGFCGGFTTFSTFSYETATLIESGQWPRAILYAIASVLLSIAATFAGFAVGARVVVER